MTIKNQLKREELRNSIVDAGLKFEEEILSLMENGAEDSILEHQAIVRKYIDMINDLLKIK